MSGEERNAAVVLALSAPEAERADIRPSTRLWSHLRFKEERVIFLQK
jgi:hypothetical protein